MLRATGAPGVPNTQNLGNTALPKVACTGSSYTQQQLDSSGTTFSESNRSWQKWWHFFSNGAFNMDNWANASDSYGRGHSGANFGISGQSSTLIRDRIPDVVRSAPAMCILQQGTNNITDTSTVLTDIKASIDQLFANGIIPVYLSINGRSAAAWPGNQTALAFYVNQEIEDYMHRTGKGIFVDSNAYIIDNSTNTGVPYANALDSDGIHYNNYSGFQIGKILHQALSGRFSNTSPEICSVADIYSSDNPYGNFFTNPFFSTSSSVGTSNGAVGTGVTAGTGTASTSVGRNVTVERSSGSGTGVATLEARGAGFGNWQVLTVTPAGASGTSTFLIRHQTADITTNVPPAGTWVQACCDLNVSSFGTNALYSGFRAVGVQLDFRSSGASLGIMKSLTSYSNSFNLPNEAYSGRLYTQPFLMPSGADRIRPRVEVVVDDSMTGTGVVKAGSWSIRPVQEPITIWRF